MTDAFVPIRQGPAAGMIHVAGPRLGDRLSAALHSAYDNARPLPEDFAALLAKLDRIERRPN